MPTNVSTSAINANTTTTNNNNTAPLESTTTSGSNQQVAPSSSSDTTRMRDNKTTAGRQQVAATKRGASTQSGRSSLSSSGGSSSDEQPSRSFVSSNADYDHIRNTTLMFFLDRLYIASKDGKEARTLHDLSCLFGTKEFTKEMRQIVGNSRNGLKNFLAGYPSLFTIDGDKVYLTQLKMDAIPPVRDYNREAVEYFTQKLLQFGTSLVPIRNLFGYRSQASQEVRHVSGRNTKEFRQFLGQHEDVFEILADEHVVLKTALQELESRGESFTSLQQTMRPANEDTVIDPYLNKQFAHLIEDCLKRMTQAEATPVEAEAENNKVTIEYLHEKILLDCNNQLFLKMVKTIEDLKVFLRMHPKIFKRFRCDKDQRDYVSLMTEAERKELEVSGYPSLLMSRQHSTLRRTATNESSLSDTNSLNGLASGGQPMSLPPPPASQVSKDNKLSDNKQPMSLMIDQQQQQPQKKSPAVNEKKTITTSNESNSTTNRQSSRSMNSNSNSANDKSPREESAGPHSSLRATAPPFVPSTHLPSKRAPLQASLSSSKMMMMMNQDSTPRGFATNTKSSATTPMQRSVSNLGPAGSDNPQHHQHHHQRAAIDPRAALRSYLIKASAVNSSNGLYSPNKLSNGAQHHQPHHPAPLSRQSSNLVTNEDLRTRTVNIVREASNIVTRIMTHADAVAFDCKGYNLGFDGQITLIQFAFLPKPVAANTTTTTTTTTKHTIVGCTLDSKENNNNSASLGNGKQKPEVCIFDLITNPELAYCLKPLLESEQVVKIVHDVRNKSNALYGQFGIMLNHVFDTQVANLVIQQQETGKPAYKSRYISMSRLCEIYGDDSLTKYRNLIKSKTRHSGQQNSNNANSSNGKVKDVNYWKTRPLTDAMVYESTMDVYCLVGGVYQNLKSRIIPEYRPLFEQLNLEGVLARIKPEEIRSVKKERKIDLEVIDLKRKLYSDTTSSIVLSNREIRLLRHIDLSEEVRQKIQQCKKVAKKLERLDMKAAQMQQQQQQQSMTSQTSNEDINANEQSIDPNISVQTNGSSLSSCGKSLTSNTTTDLDGKLMNSAHATTNNNGQTTTAQPEVDSSTSTGDGGGLFNEKGELDETKMDNLMNSSMFDELQDRMIESSSLLESLANDEDDDEVASGDHHHHHHTTHKHSGSHDDCRCLCHRSSIGTQEGEKISNSSLKLSLSSHASSTDHEDASVESKAVDMAIQCDLLND